MRVLIGYRRQRTFLVLKIHSVKPATGTQGCSVWAERWWEIEPELRMQLFRSAVRASGQQVFSLQSTPCDSSPTLKGRGFLAQKIYEAIFDADARSSALPLIQSP